MRKHHNLPAYQPHRLSCRGYGRPATFSTTDTTQFKRAIDMTDDELAAIVAKARLTVAK
jgi:hypothetical protein